MDSGQEKKALLKASFGPKTDYGLETSHLRDYDMEDEEEVNESINSTEIETADDVMPSDLETSVTQRITLSWSDLSATVKIPGKKSCFGESTPATEKTILHNVDGVITSGSLLAVMGPGGSGKTTLLNVLTSRNINDTHVTGNVRLNGMQAGETINNVSAYVQRDDLFMDIVTVREHLQFWALLRMDKRFKRKERLTRVEEVLREVGLTKCADSRIGKISGGERKRLAFACEVLTNPPILFCDEPTSGLDSFRAYGIVKMLQRLAWRGRVVLCTIQQPSSEVFAMFSKVLLLSEGRTAFMGPVEKALDFFDRLGYPCPKNFNPADHFILTLSIEPGNEVETRERANAICDAFTQSNVYKEQEFHHSLLRKKSVGHYLDAIMSPENPQERSRYQSSFLTQLTQLMWRASIAQARRPLYTSIKLLRILVVSLYVSLSYFQLETCQKGVQDITGALYILVANTALGNMVPTLTTFPEEMDIVMREHGSSAYGLGLYFVTKSFPELLGTILESLLFTSVNYWLIGFNDSSEAFVLTCAALAILSCTSTALGYSVSIVSGRSSLALAVNTPILVTLMVLGGFFLNDSSVPAYLVWIKHISMFRYAYQILMTNQWKDVFHIECETPGQHGKDPIPGRINLLCPFRSGQDVLDYQNIDQDDRTRHFVLLGVITIGLYVFALAALIIRGRRTKN